MPKEKQTKTTIGIAILILSILLLLIIKKGIDSWTINQDYQAEKQKALIEVSQRIGVEPDWKAVRKYLYCDALKPGMTQVEVEQVLNSIGPYLPVPFENGGDVKGVYFENEHIYYALSPFQLFFSNGQLVEWGRGENNFGPRSDCEQQ
jgi:hypothetical protein